MSLRHLLASIWMKLTANHGLEQAEREMRGPGKGRKQERERAYPNTIEREREKKCRGIERDRENKERRKGRESQETISTDGR